MDKKENVCACCNEEKEGEVLFPVEVKVVDNWDSCLWCIENCENINYVFPRHTFRNMKEERASWEITSGVSWSAQFKVDTDKKEDIRHIDQIRSQIKSYRRKNNIPKPVTTSDIFLFAIRNAKHRNIEWI